MGTGKEAVLSNEYRFRIGDALFKVTLDQSFKERKVVSFEEEVLFTRFIHFHTTNEMFFIPNTKILICTGDHQEIYTDCILNICPFFNHYTVRKKGGYRLLFTIEKKGNSNRTYDRFQGLFTNNLKEYKINSRILEQLNFISETSFSNDFIAYESICSSLKIIFLEFLNINSPSRKKRLDVRTENYLFIIDQIIGEDYAENVDLAYVAKALHLSTKQVTRIINKNYKTSLNKLIMKRRLQVACSLLEETDLAINEIVNEVRFNSLNYFYVCFRNEYGMSPSEYRKQKLIPASDQNQD